MKIRLTLFASLFVLSASAQYTIWTVFDTLDYEFSNRYSFNDDKRDYPEQSVYWNHGILTIGTLQDTLPFNQGGFYINFTDTLGNVVWLKKYSFQNANQISARRLLVVNSSRFYVIGNTLSDGLKTFVSKFNAQGDSIFYKEYQNDNPVNHMDLIVKHTVQDSTTLDNTANADSLLLLSNEAIN
jgi:hypothetical protein